MIDFVLTGAIPPERRSANRDYAHGLGFPVIRKAERPAAWRDEPLAVIGAGPSIADRIEELRAWPGERWAINGAGRFLRERGIDFTFLTICSVVQPLDFMRPGDKALVGSWCDPEIFAQLQGCDVRIFDLDYGNIVHLTTSVTTACHLGPLLGHRRVVFFGCESSFPDGKTHVNEQMPVPDWLVVKCNGQDFLTNPQMWVQADALARVLRLLPEVYSEHSGGLLGALVANPDYDLVSASESVKQALRQEAA